MRAITVSSFGAAGVLTESDIPLPESGDGEVTVNVEAAAVGLVDVLFRRGDLADLIKLPFVPGIEVAGRIRTVGGGVDHLQPGQPVVTLSRPGGGGYAEVTLAAATAVLPRTLPDGRVIDPVTAVAAVPNTVAALAALRDAARLRPGERVLVNGATGGLASAFAGVAKSLSAASVAGSVSRPDAVDAAHALGFDNVILTSDLGHHGELFDVVVDPVGGDLRTQSLQLLNPLGRLLVVGNASGADDVAVGASELWLSNASVVGLNVGGLLAAQPVRAKGLGEHAVKLVADGTVAIPAVTLPLAEAADAHRRLEARSITGKLVLAP